MSSENFNTRTKILAATWKLMEKQGGPGVRMSDIAKEVGISRQAVYLHFETRTDLLIATTHYVDEVRGLTDRLGKYWAAESGVDILEAYIEFWANYVPEIYGLAKMLEALKDTDEAAAAAWHDRMNAVRSGCRRAVAALEHDAMLTPGWSVEEAVDFFWTMMSVHNWEDLTIASGWPIARYVERMTTVVKRALVKDFRVKVL